MAVEDDWMELMRSSQLQVGIGEDGWLILLRDSRRDYVLRCVGKLMEWNSVRHTLYKESLVRQWREKDWQ